MATLEPNYYELPAWYKASPWLELYLEISKRTHFLGLPGHPKNKAMLTIEEIIQDNKEIQESLIIPNRQPHTPKPCTCSRCQRLPHQLEELGDLYELEEIPALAGKISTKIKSKFIL